MEVRHAQDARIAALEERLGWFEDNELDLREQAERRPWLGALLSRMGLDGEARAQGQSAS